MNDTQHETPHPDLIDSISASIYLDVPHRYLLRMANLKKIPHYRLPDDSIMFCRKELSLWLRSLHVAVENATP
jgi:hypothetical protein